MARCRGGTAARLPRGPGRHGRWHAAQARRPDHHAGRRRARRRPSGSGSAVAHHRRVRQGDRRLRIAPDRRRFGPRVAGDPSGDPQAAARSRLIARPLGGHGRLPASASRTPAGPKGWRASAGDLSRSGTRPKSGAAVTPPPPPASRGAHGGSDCGSAARHARIAPRSFPLTPRRRRPPGPSAPAPAPSGFVRSSACGSGRSSAGRAARRSRAPSGAPARCLPLRRGRAIGSA